MTKVIIIGAGAAGLASAAYLAKAGMKVTVFEKNAFPGGRCASFEKDGHRFDIGATLLMMPEVYERMFKDFGREMRKELELVRMDPVYRLKYPKDELLFSSDLMQMKEQLERVEPGSYSNFLDYMDRSYRAYRVSMKHIIDRNYDHVFQFLNPVNLMRLLGLNAFGNHYKTASRYFQNDMLRTAFTFQNIYVGQNPFHASAIFSMLPFMELTDGVFFPKGGMNRVSQKLEEIALGYGVEIKYRAPVARIAVGALTPLTPRPPVPPLLEERGPGGEVSEERGPGGEVNETANPKPETRNPRPETRNYVSGVLLSDGSYHPADIVLANADLPYVYNELLPRSVRAGRISKLGYTCSAIVFHWGMDTVVPGLEQHNVFVSSDYKANIERVFDGAGYSDEPSFYLHSAARGDATAAPAGQDSVSIIVPVGHMKEGEEQDWDAIRKMSREAVLQRLAKEGYTDFEKHIKFEKAYNPVIWQNMFNLSRGAIFGSLNHNLLQMGYFRPHNQHGRYKNLFFAGGSTHPGNGVPLALISARLTSEKVIRQFS